MNWELAAAALALLLFAGAALGLAVTLARLADTRRLLEEARAMVKPQPIKLGKPTWSTTQDSGSGPVEMPEPDTTVHLDRE